MDDVGPPMGARKRKDWLPHGDGDRYLDRVHRPLQCLVFITPFLLIYQIGAAARPAVLSHLHGGNVNYRVDVAAFIIMQKFFAFFGAAGTYLPLMAVVAILIGMHLARKDKWELDGTLYGGMAAESLAWALPVFVIGLAVFRKMGLMGLDASLLQASTATRLDWLTESILSVGAGVYEELLFRLIAITLLTIIFMDALELKPATAIPLVILSSALLFSAYHHYPGNEPFSLNVFIFRAAAGVYFAGVYIFRGFGIVVGAHAIYDLMAVAFNHR